jgi:hypothetical protein
MIIKSNSQALGGGYECKTTTKKSPKGSDLDILKDSINQVNITARMPSSTTNQSASKLNLKINSSFQQKSNGISSSYGALAGSFGVGYGPIKINQKINMGSNQKSSSNKKSHNTQNTSSSQKMHISKSYVS